MASKVRSNVNHWGVQVSVTSGSARKPRRVGDEERHACAEQLALHHAQGRLTQEEFEERLGLALTAKTAGDLGRLLADLPLPASTIVGAIPSFDADSIQHLLHRTGLVAPEQIHSPWADRLVCVWSLAAGRLGVPAHTLDRARLHRELGVDPSRYAHHTALDDTRWVRDVYDRLIST
jgi:hypothetical protein